MLGKQCSTVLSHMLFIVKSTENWGLFISYCLLSQVKNKSMQHEICIQVMEKVSALSELNSKIMGSILPVGNAAIL